MGLHFRAKAFIPRFPEDRIGAINAGGKDPIMDPDTEPDRPMSDNHADRCARPRASDWLWHPWHAKLWWAAIAAYWVGKVGSLYYPAIDQFYAGALAGFLNIAFFPPLAVMVLGMGFARAWFAWSDWEFVEPTHEQMFPRRSVGGMRDPCADPLDPRSGALHWRRVDGGQ